MTPSTQGEIKQEIERLKENIAIVEQAISTFGLTRQTALQRKWYQKRILELEYLLTNNITE